MRPEKPTATTERGPIPGDGVATAEARLTGEGFDSLPFPMVQCGAGSHAVPNIAWRGLSRGALEIGGSGPGWLSFIHPKDRWTVLAQVQVTFTHGEAGQLEVRGITPGIWYELRLSASGGEQHDVFVVALDISEHKKREATLQFRATHDQLTGVYNRFAFQDHAQHALRRLQRSRSLLSVLYIDIDDFRAFNDRHGQSVGDRVLAMAAVRFGQTLRSTDLLARFGGDEFVVLCESIGSPEAASRLAERVLGSLQEPFQVSRALSVQVTAAIGVACTSDPTETADDLVTRADQALSAAKQVAGASVSSAEAPIDHRAGFDS